MLLLHYEQFAHIEHKQPALTVGCLVEKLRFDALLDIIQTVMESENPQEKFKELTESLEDCRPVRLSSKHMAGRELGRMIWQEFSGHFFTLPRQVVVHT